LPVIEKALETAGLMLGTDKSSPVNSSEARIVAQKGDW
jgi:hypothetical protein